MTPREGHQKLLALCERGDFKQAALLAQAFTVAVPEEPTFWFLLGCIRTELKDFAAAVEAFEAAVVRKPEDAGTQFNLGCVLLRLGRPADAIKPFRRAITLNPDYAAAYMNLGTALRDVGSPEAEDAFRRAMEIDQSLPGAALNLSHTIRARGSIDETLSVAQTGLSARPEDATLRGLVIRLKQDLCDFSAADDFATVSKTIGVTDGLVPPFAAIAMEDHPDRQLQRARRWTEAHAPAVEPPKFPARSHDRLRIGYFTAHFHEHPGMYLTAGLFPAFDRSRFEVVGYSLSPKRPSPTRDSVLPHLHAFHLVDHLSDAEIAKHARAEGIDIVLDHDGHTKNARIGVYAHHPAPIVVSYLGYPGSVAAPFVHYLVADETLIPPGKRKYYAESVLFMPDSYMPLDDRRVLTVPATTRKEQGLPPDAVVLGCFQNPAKLNAEVLDIWMTVMGQTEQTVLWLLQNNESASRALREEAQKRGIAPDRLIFAQRTSQEAHLERHRHADLFLDTLPFNGHTTTCDALWMGVPVITQIGEQFAARVAASLLRAAGVPELITTSAGEYTALLQELIQNRGEIDRLKSRLKLNRQSAALFDTKRYVRNLETGLTEIARRQATGQPPADIHLRALV